MVFFNIHIKLLIIFITRYIADIVSNIKYQGPTT